MKLIIVLSLLLSVQAYSQSISVGGFYDWAGPGEDEPWGELRIYPDSDSSFLFQLISSNGIGKMDVYLGRAKKIEENKYQYYKKEDNLNCKIIFDIDEKFIAVETDKNCNNCSAELINVLNENFNQRTKEIPQTYNIGSVEYRFEDLKDY